MALFSKKIGIDLGTINVLISYNGQIVLNEPAMVALSTGEEELVRAIGQDARDMWGRHPEGVEVMRPLRDGVIADYEVTEAMLRYFLRKIGARGLRGPEVMVSVPYGVTSVEKRAVHEATIQSGARAAYLI